MPICDSSKVLECGCSEVHGKGTAGVGRPSHRWGSIGVIEREVSALNLFQTPRPASPKVIFQNAKVLKKLFPSFRMMKPFLRKKKGSSLLRWRETFKGKEKVWAVDYLLLNLVGIK